MTDGSIKVSTDVIDPQGSDYASTINKVKAAAPDAIFYGGYYAQAGRLLKQLRDGGVEAQFLSGDGSLDAGLAKGAGGVQRRRRYRQLPMLDRPHWSGRCGEQEAEAYKAKFNADTAIYSGEGYDAATAFIEAIKAGKTDTESINEYFKTIDVPGVTKQIKFAENGEPAASDVYVYLFKGGKYSLLGNAKEATKPA